MIKLRPEYRFLNRGAGKARVKFCVRCFGVGFFLAVRVALAAPLHDFGSVGLNSSPVTYAFTASVAVTSSAPVWSITGSSFSTSSITCTVASGVANCSGTINFAPQYPGLNTGAAYAKDSSGKLLATYLFRGVGLAPQLAFTPGLITTSAGNGLWAYADGLAAAASFRNPCGVALDRAGNLYVADSVNQVIRKITAGGVSTFAGTGQAGYSGDSGAATLATLSDPTGVAIDAANNIYIADQGNNLIRRVDAVSGVITTVAGGGSTSVTASSSNVPARNAALYGPQSVAVDPAGNLFISDSLHQKVLRVDAATNFITVYAGGGTGGGSDGLGDGGAATAATLNNPTGLALDSANNLYIADTGDSMIRMVNSTSGAISVVAGSGNYGYSGDFGVPTSASLASPMGVRVDAAGNLYIADFGNNVIRLVLSGANTISTLVGSGKNGYAGDGALAPNAVLANPSDIALGPAGTLFIADYGNNVIRQVSLTAQPLNFSSTAVGTVSALQTLSLINLGNQPLSLSGLGITSVFKQVTNTASCNASSVLQAGGTCNISLEFVPTAAGSIAGNLSITTNSLNITSTSSVGLSGVGTSGSAPAGTLSTTSLNFGSVASGTSNSLAVTLTNSGNAPLNISGIALAGSNAFAISTNCGTALAAGTTCTTTVTFAPTAGSSFSGTLTFSDSLANSPQQVTISGSATGGPVGTVSSNSLYFSSVLSNGSVGQPITLTNTGTGSLSVAGISLGGPNSGDFSLTTTCGGALSNSQSCSVMVYFSAGAAGVRTATLSIADNGAGSPHTIALSGTGSTTPLRFVPITPCRIADTRLANGPFGGPELGAGTTRTFLIPNSACGIPANAAAYSLNVSVVPENALGYLEIWPSGISQPLAATLIFQSQVRANAAIVTAGVGGGIQVFVSQASHVILDMDGYFVAGNPSALQFYPVTPCRVVDTRLPTGPLGGPFIKASTFRSFPIMSSACNVPSTAQAYSLNFSAVPHGPLYYLSTWPSGQPQPVVATLSAGAGLPTSNAAIVEAGTGGAIAVYTSNDSDVVIDMDGYFAPAGSGGLSLYPLSPCRALDTRNAGGLFNGTLNVNFTTGPCSVPGNAQAYVFNATVVPPGYFGFLSLWPSGSPQPVVATLLATDGSITSNMAIVPGNNGSISAYVTNPTQLVIDLSSYFAP